MIDYSTRIQILSMTGWASFEEYQIKTGDCKFLVYIKDGVVFNHCSVNANDKFSYANITLSIMNLQTHIRDKIFKILNTDE